MTATVYGVACAEKDLAAHYNRHGRLTGAHSVDELIPDLDGPITVTIDHDDAVPVGVLVHGELDERGRLLAVCAVDDWVAEYDGPLYYSAELLAIGPGVATRSKFIATAAALAGLSITDNPAVVAAQPLTILPGDVRDSGDRHCWEMSWPSRHPLLERCTTSIGPGATRHAATRLLDRRHRDRPPAHGWIDPDGRPSHGPLRHSVPIEGSILSVR